MTSECLRKREKKRESERAAREREREREGSSPLTVHSSLPPVLQARGKGKRDAQKRRGN